MKMRFNGYAAIWVIIFVLIFAGVLVGTFTDAQRHAEGVVLNIPGANQVFPDVRNVVQSGDRVTFDLPSGQRILHEGSYTIIYSAK